MHIHIPLEIVSPLVQIGALAIGGWLARYVTGRKEQERAQHLSLIASEAAALVVSLNPSAPWATLLQQTVDQIANAAGVPTKNQGALQRAAAAALAGLGKGAGGGAGT